MGRFLKDRVAMNGPRDRSRFRHCMTGFVQLRSGAYNPVRFEPCQTLAHRRHRVFTSSCQMHWLRKVQPARQTMNLLNYSIVDKKKKLITVVITDK